MARLIDPIIEHRARCRMAHEEIGIVGSPEALNDLYQNSGSSWLDVYRSHSLEVDDKRLIDPFNNPNGTSKNNEPYDPKIFNEYCNDVYILSCSCVNEIMNS